ncbi:amidohydrolase family protein [Pseudonocardia ailaonensis]
MGIWTVLEASGDYYGKPAGPPEDDILGGAERQIRLMDEVGTDIQLTSPRPFVTKNSHQPGRIVHYWTEINNDVIATQVAAHPDRLRGIGALPFVHGRPVSEVFEELHRLLELGFVGIVLNPDPAEGLGGSPLLHDEYWYPLYELMIEHDVPGLLHSSACYGRENYSEHFISEESLAINSIIRGRVFERYPDLKLIIPHGGGSIPYQIGRWLAHDVSMRQIDPGREPYQETLKRFWFDTCLYSEPSLQLLFDTVGTDRVLFGTERPGSGGPYDDLKPVLEKMTGIDDADRAAIFEQNARNVYSRLPADFSAGS